MNDPGEARGPQADGLQLLRRCEAELAASKRTQTELEAEVRGLRRNLAERLKEMSCLYEISKLRDRHGIATDEVLQGIVELIPAAWQFPDITCARLAVGRREFRTERFEPTAWGLTSDILVSGSPAGLLEVFYADQRPLADDGPFLKEERSLLDAVAERVQRVLEHEQAEKEARDREQQLIQLDKMAALGTMVSGVAHEVNNPNNFIMLNTPILLEAYQSILPILEQYHRENGDFLVGGIPYTEMKDSIPCSSRASCTAPNASRASSKASKDLRASMPVTCRRLST
jgi:hypothetical protein